jgi:ribonuclease Z
MMLAPSTSISIPLGNGGKQQQSLTLTGCSRAGDATAFAVPELNWMLDCGAVVSGGQSARTIFLSHTHADHVQCLPQQISRRLQSLQSIQSTSGSGAGASPAQPLPPIQIYLPATAAPFVDRFLQAHLAMIECNPTTATTATSSDTNNVSMTESIMNNLIYELCPVVPGQEIILAGGKKGGGTEYVVRIVKCFHRIDCVGYSMFRRYRGKLLPQYAALPGPEIGRLKQQGVAVHEQIEEPVLVFLGDTTHEVFTKHTEILQQHATIMVECTFLNNDDDDDDKIQQSHARAQETQHMHWDNLRPIVQSHPDTLFLLIHFSLKYSCLRIRRFFQDYPNVHPVLRQQEIDEAWHKHPEKNPVDETSPPVCCCFRCQATSDSSNSST